MSSSTASSAAPPATDLSLVHAGGLPFLITAFIGRLPAATVQLGLLLYVSGAGLGLGLAGVTVAVAGLGAALGAPLVGRLVDRVGPLPVVLCASAVQLAGLGLLLAAVLHEAPPALVLACAAVIGAANPQVGAIARAHWSGLARRRRQPALIGRALGYETACDETGFILGPVIAGVLVGLLGANPALIALMAWVLVGQGCFVGYLLTHRTEHGGSGVAPAPSGGSGRIRISRIVPPMIVCFCVGTVFGSTQTALTAINATRGTEAYTGIIYGCMGVGSAFASLLVSRLPRRIPLAARVAGGALVIALTCVALLPLPGSLAHALLFVVIGLGVGTMLVSAYTRGERIAPGHRMASVMTLLTTCLVLGVSFGAALGGVLSVRPQHSYVLTMAAAATGLLAAVALQVTRPDRDAAR